MRVKWSNLAILAGCIVLLLYLTRFRAALRRSCDAFMLLFWKDGDELSYALIVIIVVVLITALIKLFFG